MPNHIRLIACYGNGAVALLFVLVALNRMSKDTFGLIVFFLLLAFLAAFNIYIIEKAAGLLSSEEQLQSEIRQANLRRQLVALTSEGQPPTSPE